MLRRVDLSEQFLKYEDEIKEAVARVLASGRYTLATEVEAFEREFAEYLGVSTTSLAVADGTRAISMVLVGP